MTCALCGNAAFSSAAVTAECVAYHMSGTGYLRGSHRVPSTVGHPELVYKLDFLWVHYVSRDISPFPTILSINMKVSEPSLST